MLVNILMTYFLSMELLMPKPRKNQLCCDKGTLVALAGEAKEAHLQRDTSHGGIS